MSSKKESSKESEPAVLRRSSRSTRGSVKPVVDLTKIASDDDRDTSEEKEPVKKSSSTSRRVSVKKEPAKRASAKKNVKKEVVDSSIMSEASDDEKDIKLSQPIEENDDVDDVDDDNDEDYHISPVKKATIKKKQTKKGTTKQTPASKRAVKQEAEPEEPSVVGELLEDETDEKFAKDMDDIYYELNEKEMKEVNHAFDMNCPQDGDELLSGDGLKAAIRSLGFEPRVDEIKELLKRFAKKGRKSVNRDGFHKMMAYKFGSSPGTKSNNLNDEISRVFNLLDIEKTGFITLANLKSIAKELNEDLNEEELLEMIQEADQDGDLMINKKEFQNIMKKTSLY